MERWRLTAGHLPGPLVLALLIVGAALVAAEAGVSYRR